MRLRICVEINGVFYESLTSAGKVIGCRHLTVKDRCLSDKFPNYKIINFKPAEKRCTVCGKIKLLKEFSKKNRSRDGYRFECRLCAAKDYKKWLNTNRKYKKEYDKKHKSLRHVKDTRNKKARKKRKTDIIFKLNTDVGNSIRNSLKSKKNGAHWEDLVGYTLLKLMAHLESKFTDGMSWDNYGYGDDKWNIDHIIAICHWNITSAECQEFKDCWSLNNLQPLWQIRNFKKGNRPMEPKYLIKPDWIK